MVREIEINGIEVSYMVDYEADTCAYWFGVPGTHDTRTDMFTCLDGRDVKSLIKVFVTEYLEHTKHELQDRIETINFNGVEAHYIVHEKEDLVVYWCYNPNFDAFSDESPVINGTFAGASDGKEIIEENIEYYVNKDLGVKSYTKIKMSSRDLMDHMMAQMPTGGIMQLDAVTALVHDELLEVIDSKHFNYQILP